MFSHMKFIALYIREYDHIVLVHYRDISDGREVTFSYKPIYILTWLYFSVSLYDVMVGFIFTEKTN